MFNKPVSKAYMITITLKKIKEYNAPSINKLYAIFR